MTDAALRRIDATATTLHAQPPAQSPSLTYPEQQARATRPSLWPAFLAPPAMPWCPGGDDCECHDEETP